MKLIPSANPKRLKVCFGFHLLLLLFSCGNEPALPKKKAENPITVQFFETYSMDDIRDSWKSVFTSTSKGTQVNLGKSSSNQIIIGGFMPLTVNQFNTVIVFVKKSDVRKIDSILAMTEVSKRFPKDLQFMWSINPTEFLPEFKGYELYAVKVPKNKKAPIDSRDILESVPALDNENPDWVDIHVTMTEAGSKKLEAFTKKNLMKHIAITLDGKVVSCSQVQTVITNGMEIDGAFSMEQAGDLSDRINAGK
jgi:hypothetical protein